MKLSRPVIASAAAIAIAAGSLSAANVVNAEDKAPLDDVAVAPANPSPAEEPAPAEAPAPVEEPAAEVADAAEAPEAPASVGATADGAATPSDVDTAVNGLLQQGDVDPEIEALAQNEPEHNSEPTEIAAMRRINGRADAPRKVYGNTKEAQSWYGQKNVEGWYVYSKSMEREIPVALIRATDANGNRVDDAPTLYLLNGAGGAEQDSDWVSPGNANTFYAGKGVNVVIPMEGAFSYYVDWLTDGETLKSKSRYFKGKQMWTTFLGEELPPAVENELNANDKRGVLGFSMSATSSLLLAQHFPGRYDAVASFSGCAATSTPLPWAFAALTVNRAANTPNYSSITPAHIWGPMGSPYNRYNDALVNAEKLRGSKIYISNGSGTASQSDMIGLNRNTDNIDWAKAISGSMTTTIEGGVIEAATNSCTHDLRAKLNANNIPAHYEFRKAGTHSWGVWYADRNRSWNTTFGPAFFGEGNFVKAQEFSTTSPTWNADGSSS